MSGKGSQDSSAQKKKCPGEGPVPKQKGVTINEPSSTRPPVRVNPSGNVGSAKGKEKMVDERPAKRPRIYRGQNPMEEGPAQTSVGAGEITRAEFDGNEIFSLYAGDTLILPPTDKTAEDVQGELSSFTLQVMI